VIKTFVFEGGDEIAISNMVFQPQTDGQTERVNGVLKLILQKLC
jgi:hypothetical protein